MYINALIHSCGCRLICLAYRLDEYGRILRASKLKEDISWGKLKTHESSLLLNKGSMRRGSIAFFGMAPSRANRPAIQRGEVKSQLYLCRLKNGSG